MRESHGCDSSAIYFAARATVVGSIDQRKEIGDMSNEPITASVAEPITAEIVPPPPSPFSFGLQALFGLTAVCSLQFALMSYLGVLVGLAVGTAICLAGFALVMFFGIAIGGRNGRLTRQLDAIVIRLMLAIVVLCIGTMFAGGGVLGYQYFTETRAAFDMDRQLGLLTRRVDVVHNNQVVQALSVITVLPGRVADRSGLKAGDVILLSGTVQEHYEMLAKNRGQSVDLHLADGALITPVENCPQRQVSVPIPK
jgi:hypothetical protein